MNNKWTIAIVIGVLFAFLIAYWLGKSYGKSLPPKKIPLPDDVEGERGKLSDEKIKEITDAFYEDIRGVSLFNVHNMQPYMEYLVVSNKDKVKIINDWNNRYYHKWNEDLATAIEGEGYGSQTKLALTVAASIRDLSEKKK